MDYTQKRELYIPNGFTKVEYESINYVVYYFERNNKPCAATFGGRRTKPDQKYSFGTEDQRQNWVNEEMAEKVAIQVHKEQRKAIEKKQQEDQFRDIKIGDVFHQGGGYDQTNCAFWQLTDLKGKTGTFKRIGSDIVPGSEGFMSCKRTPDVGNFMGEPQKFRITGDRIKPGYDRAYKCNPTDSFYNSWYA